jgi:hypothetical protein
MQESGRRTRPPVDRTEPRRSFLEWTKGFSEAGAGQNQGSEGATETSSPQEPAEPASRTVNDAYRLIDEYIRKGQKAAEDLWIPQHGAEREDERFNLPVRFMRAMGDMTMAWVEMMQQWTPASREHGPVGPFTAGRAPAKSNGSTATGAQRALRVSIATALPVDVTVHFAEGSDVADLVATELRSFTGNASPITDVKLEYPAPGDAPVLRIHVSAEQAPGTYNGLLLDAASQSPRGTISLMVRESAP